MGGIVKREIGLGWRGFGRVVIVIGSLCFEVCV